MPKTIGQTRIESAARVLAKHFPRSYFHECACGQEWTPLHQAKMLSVAGCLGPESPHEHVWTRHQNVTTKGYVMQPYEACECGAARQVSR